MVCLIKIILHGRPPLLSFELGGLDLRGYTGKAVGLLPVEPGEAAINGTELPYILEIKSALDVALRCYQLLADSWRVAIRPGWSRE